MGTEPSKPSGRDGLTKRADSSLSPPSVGERCATKKPSFGSGDRSPEGHRSPRLTRYDRRSRYEEADSSRQRDRYSPFRLPISPPPVRRASPLTKDAGRNEHRRGSQESREPRRPSSPSPGRQCHVQPARPELQSQTPRRSSSIDNQYYIGHGSSLNSNAGGRLQATISSWKAPDSKASKAKAREKIEHKCLAGVPTGPKQSSGRQSEAFRAYEAAESMPHIFIPDSSLAAMPTTHPHLARRLNVQEQDICRGEYEGWRIVFPDSEVGRESLEDCYENFHLRRLFKTCVLNMQRFPHGSPGRTSAGHAQRHQPARSKYSPQKAEKETQDMSQPERSLTDLNLRKTAGLGSTCSSPTMARMDKDDSSSALTGSDTSASKGSTCHVCKTRAMSGVEALVPCSTCVRKYHRRCHPGSSPPADSDSLSAWQCRRCARLQVAPKSHLSNASFPAATPVPSVGQPEVADSPAMELERELGTGQSQARESTNTACAPSPKPSQAAQNDGADAAAASLTEADDLVEKSFAQLGGGSRDTQPPKKTSRLALARRKIEPPKEVLGEARAGSSVDQIAGATGDEGPSKAKRKLDIEEPTPNKRRAQEGSASGADRDTTTKGVQITGNSLDAQSASSTMGNDDAGDSEDGIRTTQTFRPIPQPKLRHKPVQLRLRKPGDSSQTKGKSHKWSGGGTEKGIIQEGLRDCVDRENQLRYGQYHSSAVDAAWGMQSGRQTNGTVRQMISSSPEPRSPGTAASAPVTSKRRPGPRAKNDEGPTRPCVKCGNTARLGPAGDNQLCVPCRKMARDNPAAQGVDVMPSAPEPASAPSEISQLNSAIGTGAFVNDQDEPSRTGNATLNGKKSRGLDDTFGGILKRVTSRTACSSCSKKHQKCTHPTHSGDVGDTNASRSRDEMQTYDVEQSPTKPTDSNTTMRGGKDADEEAQPGEDGGDVDAPAGPKRKCYRSKPKDQFDLGDSWNRPLGTYEKLIGMALCSTEGLRMKYNEVVQWVAENIPNYKLKEGNNWESNIKATISLRRYQSEDNRGLWRTEPVDSLNKAKGNMVELLPGLEKSMSHWDPVLKTPVSPMKLDRTARAVPAEEPKNESQESRETPPLKHRRRSRPSRRQVPETVEKYRPTENDHSKSAAIPSQRGSEQADADMQDRPDGAGSGVEDSQRREAGQQDPSDDEPFSRRKSSRTNGLSAYDEPLVSATKRSFADLVDGEIDAPRHPEKDNQIEHGTGFEAARAPALAVSANPVSRARSMSPPTPRAQPRAAQDTPHALSLAEMIQRDSQQNDCSALSLFEEWPEYDPSNRTFDKAAKIAEIQARPRRKQRFRAPLSRDSRTGLHIAYPPAAVLHTSNGNSASFGRLNRTPSKTQRTFDPFQLQNAESNVTMCDTWEEFFDLPSNPIAIMHEGQLAYRDGTRNEDGLLPRAKVIFKTGYA